MGGLLLGDRNSFSADFKDAMKGSGTTHLIALSGFNITILVNAIALVLGSFLSRKLRFALSIIIIVLFIVMVGAEASVVRAGIMGALLLLAKESGRIYSPKNAIAFAGFSMTIWDPNNVFDIGFILSFVSLAGIVYVLPAVKNIFLPRKNPKGVAEAALMTISAQTAVLPIVIKTFGGFSLAAIISNSLITGFVPYAMFLGFLIAVANFFSGALAFFFAFFTEISMKYFIFIIEFFSRVKLPFGDFLNIPYAAAIYYICLIIFVYAGITRTKK
jgi:competence protein ComEC